MIFIKLLIFIYYFHAIAKVLPIPSHLFFHINQYLPSSYSELPKEKKAKYNVETYNQCLIEFDKNKHRFMQIQYTKENIVFKNILILPAEFDKNKKYSITIFNRGGMGDNSSLSICEIKDQIILSEKLKNSVIFYNDYQFYENSPYHDSLGVNEVNDIEFFLKKATELSFIDLKKIYMIGWSRGGMVTYLFLKKNKSVRAAAIIAGVSELSENEIYNQLIPTYTANKKNALYNLSALNWANQIQTPILFLHGGKDQSVPFVQSEKMAQSLSKNKILNKLKIYPNEDHYFKHSFSLLVNEIEAWFQSH